MKRSRMMLTVVAFMLASSLGTVLAVPTSVAAQELPPGVTTVMESNFGPTEPSGTFQVIQLLVELPPGTATPPHVHGGSAYVTVLEGEVRYWEGDQEGYYGPGGIWIEDPGVPGVVVNASTERARLLVTFLLPLGAPLTTVVQQ